MLRPRVFKQRDDDRYQVRLSTEHREVLANLADQLLEMIEKSPEDGSLARLAPEAHPDDIASEAEWRMSMGAALDESRREQLTFLRECTDREELTEGEVIRWMQAVNAIRLVLASRLGVDDDGGPDVADDDPRAPMAATYDFLSFLLDRTLDALSD